MFGEDVREHLGSRVPSDHARQSRADHLAPRVLDAARRPDVLDLGCGSGDSIDFFRQTTPGVRWVGVDIEDSGQTTGLQVD